MKLAILLAALFSATSAFAAKNYEVKMAETSMHCSECAAKVSKALQSLPEVDKGSVKVILEKKTASLQIREGSNVTAEQIKNVIEEQTGYKVSGVEEIKVK